MNLPNTICEGIVRLACKYGLSRVVLFGSRARGDNWERSDVDLAVAGGDIVRFSLDVDEELPTLLMFDVVNLDGPVQPELLAEIQRDGVLLYEKGREFPQSVGKSQGDRGEESSL